MSLVIAPPPHTPAPIHDGHYDALRTKIDLLPSTTILRILLVYKLVQVLQLTAR